MAIAFLGCAGSSGGPSLTPGGSAGSPTVIGGGGNVGLGSGGAPPIAGGGTSGVGVTGSGGVTGAAGVAGSVALAGRGGGGGGMSVGASGAAGTSGGAGTTVPVTYPMLDPAMIGSAVGIPISVTPALALSESPLWDPCGHQLLFVDVEASAIYALKAGQVTTFAMNTNNANGIAFDIDGSLILAQMGGNPGHIARRDKSGMIKVIEPAGGPVLHTPDDVIVRSDGSIYFTDGDFAPVGDLTGSTLQLPVYILKPAATMLINGGTVSGPNGIELSPDEKTLYVDGYGDGTLWAFAVAADGSLTKPSAPLVSGLTNPDSLCLDAAGNLYVGVTSGLQVMRPDGSKIKLIPFMGTQATFGGMPGVTNCTFGGEDGKTLYITAWDKMASVANMPIPGLDWVVNQTRLKCN